jgi:hypothetical protein
MKLRRDFFIVINLIAILSVAVMRVAQAQTPEKPPSNWDLGYPVQILGLIAAVLIAGAAILLFFAARRPGESFIFKMRPYFFFWLGLTYTLLLMLVAVAYNVSYMKPDPCLIGGMLPIAVPWFGALGAVTISLEGVFQWSESRWNPEYNYWHFGRPLFGAVLGTISFFIFILIVSSSGTTPKFLEIPTVAIAPKDFIVYYVVAFLAGYREQTFRELIRRVTDMILKPATQNTATTQLKFTHEGVVQSEINFSESAVGTRVEKTIEIVNSGNVPLSAPKLTVIATDTTSEGVFGLANDNVTRDNELGPNQRGTVAITFGPRTPGMHSGVLVVASTSLEVPATIKISGSARAESDETPTAAT